MTDDNGISWFEKALKETMGEVKPLKNNDKQHKQVTYQQPKKTNDNKLKRTYKQIKKSELINTKINLPSFYTGEIDFKFSPECKVEYKDSSIDSKIFKLIKQNKFHLDSYLDLHGNTVSEAAELTQEYIEKALYNNHRFIKIITGKGYGKLKNYLIYWLDDIPYILAYCTAPISHGGNGAFIVYLKKS